MLNLAVERGRVDYPSAILDNMQRQEADFHVPEKSRGWTPLFSACWKVQYDVAKLLLEAGSRQTCTGLLCWIPNEHAVFRGHLARGSFLSTPETLDLHDRPSKVTISVTSSHTPIYAQNEKLIIVNLGSTQKGKSIAATAIDTIYCSSTWNRASRRDDQVFLLVVSIPGSTARVSRLKLYLTD